MVRSLANNLNNHIVLNEAKWDKIRKEISKENNEISTRNGGQKTNLQLTRVKSNGVSIRKLQLEKSKPAKFCSGRVFSSYNNVDGFKMAFV